MKEKVIFNWSGGKDSAFCLYKLLKQNEYEIGFLLTSISQQYQRISMHGVRVELLEKQAQLLNLPLVKMEIREMPTMEIYESVMEKTLLDLKAKGSTVSVYGDIFLEDLRKYREEQLAKLNLKAVFPLWKIPTDKLIREFIDLGFKTIVTCVNEKFLDKSFAGRIIDHQFINDLPANVDPCGENGEFHTFVFDGPLFKEPISIETGEIVYRKYTPAKKENSSDDCFKEKEEKEDPFNSGFWFCDLMEMKG